MGRHKRQLCAVNASLLRGVGIDFAPWFCELHLVDGYDVLNQVNQSRTLQQCPGSTLGAVRERHHGNADVCEKQERFSGSITGIKRF